jgi:nitroreductase
MELWEAIETRKSAGKLAAPGPSAQHLERIVAAANRAPDHGRLRPWRVLVLDDAARGRLADAVVAARRTRPPPPTDEQLTIERDKLWRSPTVVVVGCAVVRDHPKVPEIEQVLSVGAAVQNMCLAAHDLGYGFMWKTGPAAYESGVKRAVGLAPDDHIVAILHLGMRVT